MPVDLTLQGARARGRVMGNSASSDSDGTTYAPKVWFETAEGACRLIIGAPKG